MTVPDPISARAGIHLLNKRLAEAGRTPSPAEAAGACARAAELAA